MCKDQEIGFTALVQITAGEPLWLDQLQDKLQGRLSRDGFMPLYLTTALSLSSFLSLVLDYCI